MPARTFSTVFGFHALACSAREGSLKAEHQTGGFGRAATDFCFRIGSDGESSGDEVSFGVGAVSKRPRRTLQSPPSRRARVSSLQSRGALAPFPLGTVRLTECSSTSSPEWASTCG